jgi:hypothetical protein
MMDTGFDGYTARVAIKWNMVWVDDAPWLSHHRVDFWIGTTLVSMECSIWRWQAWWCWLRTHTGALVTCKLVEWGLGAEFPAVLIDHEPYDESKAFETSEEWGDATA